jgi:protein-disulfide isomerase
MSAQDAFREMEANGVHKQGQPTAAAAPDQKQQEKEAKEEEKEEKVLPKLSAAEFRVYNRMAEHMDMFVSHHCSS